MTRNNIEGVRTARYRYSNGEDRFMDRKSLLWAIALAAITPLVYAPTDAWAGTTYRWVDDNGNPVLSDRPPETGTAYTEVGVESGFRRYPKPAPENPPQKITAADSAPSSVTSQSAPSGSSEVVSIIEPKPELCAQAKDNIFKLETFPRMRVQDDDGEVRFMSDDERAAQLKTANTVRDANCN